MKWKDSCSLEEKLWLTGGIFKSEDSTFLTKFHIVKAVIFLVVMHECESWTILKAEHWRIVVLDKTVESPLECEEIKPINPKGNQPWTFIGRTDAGAEVPILWPPDAKSRIIGKDPDAGKDWRQQEKGAAEDVKMGRNLSKLWEIVKDRESWCAAVPGVSKSWTWVSNWTTTTSQIKLVQLHRSHSCGASHCARGCHLPAGLQLFLGCFMSLCDSLRCCRFPEGSCAFLLILFEWSAMKTPVSWLFCYSPGCPSWLSCPPLLGTCISTSLSPPHT